MEGENLLTVHEVASRMRVRDYTVRAWLRSGRLRGVKPGRRGWRVRAKDVEQRLAPQSDDNPLERALKTLDELTPTIIAGYRGKFNVADEMEAMREERDQEIAGE